MKRRDYSGMTQAKVLDALNALAVATSRAFKELFWRVPLPRGRLWRWMFASDEGAGLRRVGEQALDDLAGFCFARTSTFHSDPLIMARREGRRDVWLRITNYLNLDEAQVQQILENDYEL